MVARILILVAVVVALLLLLTPNVPASCRVVTRSAFVSKPVVVEKVIVKEVPVFTRFVTVALLADLPTYSAVYAPPVVAGVPAPLAAPAVQPGPPAPSSEMQQIMGYLKSLDGRLQRLEAGMPLKQGLQAPPGPPPAPKMKAADEGPPGAVGPLQAKCASCHELTKAPGDGGGFVMFDGAVAKTFSAEQKLKIARKIRSGAMPPADSKIAPVTEEEYAKIAEALGF